MARGTAIITFSRGYGVKPNTRTISASERVAVRDGGYFAWKSVNRHWRAAGVRKAPWRRCQRLTMRLGRQVLRRRKALGHAVTINDVPFDKR